MFVPVVFLPLVSAPTAPAPCVSGWRSLSGWVLASLVGSGCFAQTLDADRRETDNAAAGESSTTAQSKPSGSAGDGGTALSTATSGGGGTDNADDVPPDAGTDRRPYGGPCCEPHRGPGCDDPPGVDMCVCALDDYCCTEAWDEVCVDVAMASGCLDCGTSSIPTRPSDCCEATRAAGCTDPMVAACVCAQDSFCCEVQWDQACVDHVATQRCGCGFETTAGETGVTLVGDCCSATEAAGCLDAAVQACVCDQDPFCCDTAWDNQCVALVNVYGCGACAYPLGDGDCCEASGAPGCAEQAVQDCVCDNDPFCCSVGWDASCVTAVDAYGCGMCPGGPSDTGYLPTTSGSGGAMTSSST